MCRDYREQEMACITFDGNRYLVGADFADATNAPRSHGLLTYSGSDTRYSWQSTLSQQDTEHVLRAAAAKESKRITFFRSQAV